MIAVNSVVVVGSVPKKLGRVVLVEPLVREVEVEEVEVVVVEEVEVDVVERVVVVGRVPKKLGIVEDVLPEVEEVEVEVEVGVVVAVVVVEVEVEVTVEVEVEVVVKVEVEVVESGTHTPVIHVSFGSQGDPFAAIDTKNLPSIRKKIGQKKLTSTCTSSRYYTEDTSIGNVSVTGNGTKVTQYRTAVWKKRTRSDGITTTSTTAYTSRSRSCRCSCCRCGCCGLKEEKMLKKNYFEAILSLPEE